MNSLHEVSAEQVMTSEPETVEKTQSLGSVKNFMEERGLRAVPVEHDGSFEGVISYRELIRHVQYNPESSKLDKVIHNPPGFDLSDSLIDVAKLRIESGKKMLVATSNNKIEGVIGDQQFLDVASGIKEFDSYSTSNLSTDELVKVFEQDPVDKARNLMLDKNISRLPVLNEDGKITGIVRSTDMLKMIVPEESQRDSGSSPRSIEGGMKGSGEKESMSDITVNQIMDSTITEIKVGSTVAEAVEVMRKAGTTDVMIVENGYPGAILTVKDLIQYIRDQHMGNMMMVNLVGVELAEEKAAVHNKIETQLKGSLGRKLERPQELTMHFKKHDKDGERHRYEVITKLYSEYGMITTNVEAWDLLESVDKALDELNTVVGKKKEERTEHR